MSHVYVPAGEVLAAQRLHQQRLNAQRMHAVYAAARLQRPGSGPRNGASKQETPNRPGFEVSTAHHLRQQEVRAAGAQSDTTG